MEAVYKKIVDTFNANPQVFTDNNLPTLRQIDINYGQTENPADFEIFFPAMFVDWKILAGKTGESDKLIIDFHIIQEPGVATENFSPVLEAGVEYLRFIKGCRFILNKLKTDHSSPLVYDGERQAVTPYFRYHIVSYRADIDQYIDSFWRPRLTEGSVESVNLTGARLRKTEPAFVPLDGIDTYK